MNEHAKKIWKAALDGETVQHFRGGFEHEWVDMDPFEVSYYSRPQQVPDRWRIKPETKTNKFRVYFDLEDKKPRIVYFTEQKETIERPFYFGGWLSDELSYEVEVEE